MSALLDAKDIKAWLKKLPEWDQDKKETPLQHLSTEIAHQLVDLALDQYGREMDRPPQRVVIHKTSRFWDAEKEGFESAIKERVNGRSTAVTCPTWRLYVKVDSFCLADGSNGCMYVP